MSDICDRCQEPFDFDALTYIVTLPGSWFHEEEGVLLCGECIGETE